MALKLYKRPSHRKRKIESQLKRGVYKGTKSKYVNTNQSRQTDQRN